MKTRSPNFVYAFLIIIFILSCLSFTSLYAYAGVNSDINNIEKESLKENTKLLQQLKDQADMIKWASTGVVGALAGVIGLLYRTQIATHNQMVLMIASESKVRLETVEKVTTALVEVSYKLNDFAVKLADVTSRLDGLSDKIDNYSKK